VAPTVKVAVVPALLVRLNGWLVITGGSITVSVTGGALVTLPKALLTTTT